jgi:diapolycopene oxygenase
MSDRTGKRVVVVGAGLGGLSAAISLAQEGYRVEVCEKNGQVGGKLNLLQAQGYTFDLGPSILTLPHIFERLFERSGRRMRDYVAIRTLRPHWRSFFEDGTVFDLVPEPDAMAAELARLGPGLEPAFRAFLQYSEAQYDLIRDGYFERGLDTVPDFLRFYKLRFFRFDWLRTMHRAVAAKLPERHLVDVMDFFIKYVGSSAYRAPAFMNCMPTIQFRHDLWYVDGGLYGLARGLERLARELGVSFRLEAEVAAIRKAGRRVSGVTLRDGAALDADIVVSNMEVIPAYRQLLGEDECFMRSLSRFEPACSGLVLDLGLDCQYPQLAHHNFLFSGDQRKHFDTVFRKHEIPEDPTLYVVAASRSDPSVAPAGCDCLKILPHIPYINDAAPCDPAAYRALRDRMVAKLERMGLKDLRRHIVFEHFWTPIDIRRMYNSNGGSIYGVVSDLWKNLAFKAPKQSPRYENLFFVGGSVNPGGGMPMVVLCGQNVARKIVQWDRG